MEFCHVVLVRVEWSLRLSEEFCSWLFALMGDVGSMGEVGWFGGVCSGSQDSSDELLGAADF